MGNGVIYLNWMMQTGREKWKQWLIKTTISTPQTEQHALYLYRNHVPWAPTARLPYQHHSDLQDHETRSCSAGPRTESLGETCRGSVLRLLEGWDLSFLVFSFNMFFKQSELMSLQTSQDLKVESDAHKFTASYRKSDIEAPSHGLSNNVKMTDFKDNKFL